MAPKKTVSDQEQVVLDYLNKQYRPYSTNDIFQNLHGAIGKTAVNKAIESLSAKGDIITKLFGKMAISVARKVESENQSEEIEIIQTSIQELAEEQIELEEEISQLQEEYVEMTQYPDDKALKEKLDALTTDIKELENKVKSLKTKPSLSEESVRAIRLTILNITKESDKRSKLYKNFMMLLSEHLDPKQLINTLGLEEPVIPKKI